MVAARRRDPLKNFQFRIKLFNTLTAPTNSGLEYDPGNEDGAASGYVAGVTRVSGLSAMISAAEHWSGGNSLHRHAHPDRCVWDPITLEQGLAIDNSLADWAEAAIKFASGAPDAGVVKRGVILDVWDPTFTRPPQSVAGDPLSGVPPHPMYRYVIHNAWVSRYQALPGLDSAANEVALLSVEITHEGWRATGVSGNIIAPDVPPNFEEDDELFDPFGDPPTAIA